MIDFNNADYLKLHAVDNEDFQSTVGPLLVEGESIHQAFRTVRDGVVFTNKRIITVNMQGVTGKKKDFSILPYNRIQAFSIETAGVFDIDTELNLWFSGMGKIHFEFTARADVAGICRHISQCIL